MPGKIGNICTFLGTFLKILDYLHFYLEGFCGFHIYKYYIQSAFFLKSEASLNMLTGSQERGTIFEHCYPKLVIPRKEYIKYTKMNKMHHNKNSPMNIFLG